MTFASGSGAIVLSGGIINLAATSTITVSNAADTINSVLAGAGTSLTKAGAGTLVLSGTNTYAGTTSLFGSWSGTLKIYSWTDGADHLFFGTGSGTGLDQSQLDQIKFLSDAGSTILPFAPGYSCFTGGFGEVVPVPEPSSVATVMGLPGLIGRRERRQARQARAAERRA